MSKEHQYTSTNNNDNLLRNKVAVEQDLIGIKNLIDQFVDAWNKHDAKLFAVLLKTTANGQM
jgi:flagellar capping protein FliD